MDQSHSDDLFLFKEWCARRKISKSTGRRLIKAGRVKITRLSERIIAIRQKDDQAYLDSCVEERP